MPALEGCDRDGNQHNCDLIPSHPPRLAGLVTLEPGFGLPPSLSPTSTASQNRLNVRLFVKQALVFTRVQEVGVNLTAHLPNTRDGLLKPLWHGVQNWYNHLILIYELFQAEPCTGLGWFWNYGFFLTALHLYGRWARQDNLETNTGSFETGCKISISSLNSPFAGQQWQHLFWTGMLDLLVNIWP